MERSICFFQRCIKTTAHIAISSGKPCEPPKILTFFRQYTISILNIVAGKALPRYVINFGVGFFSENITNGKNLVIIEPILIIAIVIIY